MAYTQYDNNANAYNVQQQGNYPPPPPPQYAYPPVQGYAPVYTVEKNGAAVAGLVIGLICMVAWLLPIVGVPLSIVGIVQAKRGQLLLTNRSMATAGFVLCTIALVLALINAAAGVLMAMH